MRNVAVIGAVCLVAALIYDRLLRPALASRLPVGPSGPTGNGDGDGFHWTLESDEWPEDEAAAWEASQGIMEGLDYSDLHESFL